MKRVFRDPPLRLLHPLLLMLRMELLAHLVLGHSMYQGPVSPSLPASSIMPTNTNMTANLSTPALLQRHLQHPEDFQCDSHRRQEGSAEEVAVDVRPQQQSNAIPSTGNKGLTYLLLVAMAWPPTNCPHSEFLEHLQPWPHTPSWGRLHQLLPHLWYHLLLILNASRLSPREFGQSPAPFSGLVRPAVYSPGVLAWDGKGLLKLIYVYYGIREKLSP